MKGGSVPSNHGGKIGTQDKHIASLALTAHPRPTDLDINPTFGNQGYLVHVSSSKGSVDLTDEERSSGLPQEMLRIGIQRTYTVD